MHMNGPSALSMIALGGTDINYECAAIADYNRDGVSDIFWRHKGNGTPGVFLMRNSTVYQLIGASVLSDPTEFADRVARTSSPTPARTGTAPARDRRLAMSKRIKTFFLAFLLIVAAAAAVADDPCPCFTTGFMWLADGCQTWNCAVSALVLANGDPHLLVMPTASNNYKWVVLRRVVSASVAVSPDAPFIGRPCLRRTPFQTVHADFPHTAYRWSLGKQHYATSGY